MKPLSSFLVVLSLLAPVSALADECAFLQANEPAWLAELADSVDLLECRALTDKDRNNGKPLTLHQLEQVRMRFKSDTTYIDTIWMRFRLARLNKKIDCMSAFGDYRTCHCLGESLPVDVSFVGYVMVVTSAPGVGAAQFGVSNAEFSKLTGILWSVRDQCIAGR